MAHVMGVVDDVELRPGSDRVVGGVLCGRPVEVDAPPTILDLVFRPEHSDFELGDAYVTHGHSGVYALKQRRLMAAHVEFSPINLRYEVADDFGISPGDMMPWLVM